jgi:hypothetical protein
MRTDQEVFITDLVHKHRHHLVKKGLDLLQKDQHEQHPVADELSIGTVIFSKLLEGCLLTLAYSVKDANELYVVDWRFTDPACN